MDARGGNSFANWGAITKKHEDFLKAIRNAPIHLVLCLRSKQEHVQDKDDKGKTTIRKIGMAAVQRDGMEFELTTVFDLAMDHNYKVSKDRTRLFDGRMEMVTVATGQELAKWLQGGVPLAENTGEPLAHPTQPAASAPTPTPSTASSTTQKTQPTSTNSTPERPTQAGAPQAQGSPDPDYPPEWVAAMARLAEVTVGMPDKTRSALVADFEAQGPAALPELLQEIQTIQSVTTPGAVLASLPPPVKEALPQEVNTFVDGISPDTDETHGGISPAQYEALNALIQAYGINRDALRAYAASSGKLLPSKVPTLARFRAEDFAKLRKRLTNTTMAGKDETWSARTVRIINSTPTTTYQPLAAVS